jgi:hypothetical protein
MSRRVLLRVGVAVGLLLVVALALPGVRWWVYGHLRGEAMYRGRPTSYWSHEVARSVMTPFYRRSLAGLDAPTVPASHLDALKAALGLQYTVTWPTFPLRDDDPAAVPVLMELLKDPESEVRMYAAQSLGGLGTSAAVAEPALTEALQDKEVGGFGFRVCDKASWALKRVRGEEANEADESGRP